MKNFTYEAMHANLIARWLLFGDETDKVCVRIKSTVLKVDGINLLLSDVSLPSKQKCANDLDYIQGSRGVPRFDGAREKQQVLRPPCSNLTSFRSKSTVLNKVRVTLLELFIAAQWFGARGIFPPLLPRYAHAGQVYNEVECFTCAASLSPLSSSSAADASFIICSYWVWSSSSFFLLDSVVDFRAFILFL